MCRIPAFTTAAAVRSPPAKPSSAAIARRPARVAAHNPAPAQNAALRPLPSPPQRHYDFSAHAVRAIRLTHCRLLTEPMARAVEAAARSKQRTLAQLAASLSVCASSRARGGDTGWFSVGEGRGEVGGGMVVTAGVMTDEVMTDKVMTDKVMTDKVMTGELLECALAARPGAMVVAHTSYGWEVFVVEDVRHAVVPTAAGMRRGVGFPVSPNMRKTSRKKPSIDTGSYYIQTFGCQMNVSDSERMAADLRRRGYHETAEAARSAVYVLNTCALRDHAEQKVYSYLGMHAQRKWDAPGEVTLVVAGCVAQQEGERLLQRVPELDVVMGPQYANRVTEVLEEFETRGTQIVAVDPLHISEDISKPVRGSKVTAWVNVIYGCLEKCTYCVVPNTRGLEQSRSMEAIKAEVEGLARDGYREVVLLGQNVDAYGRDLYPRRTFSDLLRFLHDVPRLQRIRFTTGHPRYVSDNLISAVEELPKVMEHFHMPPQSGDDEVLRQMRRGYTSERYRQIARRIRARMPDAAICADTIVGFPGETDEAFANTVRLVDEVVFDANMVRAYSARPNTPAGLREDQVDEATKERRLAVLNAKMREQAEVRSRRYLGRVVEVLVEGRNVKNAREVMGRERTNRVVFFEAADNFPIGGIVDVLVQEAFAFSLRGRAVSAPR